MTRNKTVAVMGLTALVAFGAGVYSAPSINHTPAPTQVANSNQLQQATEEDKLIQDVCKAIQNYEDDVTVYARKKSELSPNYGDGEASLVTRYKQRRMIAKEVEKETLIANYGKQVKFGIDMATGKELAEGFSKDKPTVVVRSMLRCPSCHKIEQMLADYDFSKANFEPVILVYEEDMAKNSKENPIPAKLEKYVHVIKGKGDDSFKLKRYPSTVFIDEKGRLFDIGGCVTPTAMEQIVADKPNLDNYDMTKELEVKVH